MFQKKSKKYLHFIKSFLTQNNQLRNLRSYASNTNLFAQAFLEVKENSYSNKERDQFIELEQFREKLKSSNEPISFEEIGITNISSVGKVVKKAASPVRWSKLFYSLCKHTKAYRILEIGTNLGVSGQYFIEAIKENPEAKFTTMEGVKRMCEIAELQLTSRSRKNEICVMHGLYDRSLARITTSKEKFDLVFIDGNHNFAATTGYFNLLKTHFCSNAIVIVDDINWSKEMQQAWNVLKKDSLVYCSVDLFKLGVLFISSKKNTQPHNHQLFLGF